MTLRTHAPAVTEAGNIVLHVGDRVLLGLVPLHLILLQLRACLDELVVVTCVVLELKSKAQSQKLTMIATVEWAIELNTIPDARACA
jgi:hypothetical protein